MMLGFKAKVLIFALFFLYYYYYYYYYCRRRRRCCRYYDYGKVSGARSAFFIAWMGATTTTTAAAVTMGRSQARAQHFSLRGWVLNLNLFHFKKLRNKNRVTYRMGQK